MALLSLRVLTACAALLLWPGAPAWAQAAPADSASTGAAAPAFALQISAAPELQALLENHLELQRYRVLTDLSDSEVQSLMHRAQDDAAQLLATLGYFSPVVTVTLHPATAQAPRSVHIQVEPGPQTRVAAVDLQLSGAIRDDAEASQALRDLWSLASGEPFTQDAWDLAKAQALKQLLQRRYAAARLLDSSAVVRADAAQVDLAVQLDSGPAYTVGSLDVQGSQRYGDDLVRRLARVQPGQDYVQAELVQAQQRLTDSGYYDAAYLGLDLATDPAQAVVHAQVTEAAMQKAVFGIGASTDTGARLSAEHTYNQVPGIHWRAVNKLSLSRDSNSFSSDWTSQPTDSHWRWAGSALLQQDTVGAIDVKGQRYRFGRFSTEASWDQSYYAQLEHNDVIYLEDGERSTTEALSANYAFSLRHFDSTPFATRGWGLGAELSAGSTLGSGQEPYGRVLLHGKLYQPLGQDEHNLFARQHAGRMLYRAQVGAVVVDNVAHVPFNQLFLAGGDNSVRGYRYQEIGVTHNGVLSAESGRYLATGSVEWQRPIVRNGLMTDWESAVFVDTGAVANVLEEFSFKVGVGVGARWKSPIGPLQIDLAYGVATQALRLHLNVGFVF